MIKEPNEFVRLWQENAAISNIYYKQKPEETDNGQVVDFKKMKLRYEVEVIFGLK
jgi:hypothetical protein